MSNSQISAHFQGKESGEMNKKTALKMKKPRRNHLMAGPVCRLGMVHGGWLAMAVGPSNGRGRRLRRAAGEELGGRPRPPPGISAASFQFEEEESPRLPDGKI